MVFPRVTEVLRPYTNYDNIPAEILERSAARGSSVHAICAAIAKGGWIPDGMIAEELRGYVESFKKWSAAQVLKFIVVEKRYTHDECQYSGQLDCIILGSDEQLYLVDLKTSARPQKTYPVQMAAYDHLLRNHKIQVKGAMLVYLNKDGDFPEIYLLEDMTEELHVFLSALQCWHYFNKGKKNVRENTSFTRTNSSESGTNPGGDNSQHPSKNSGDNV